MIDVPESLDPILADLRSRISEIKVALVGSMTSRGLLHDVDLISARVDSLAAKIEDLDVALGEQGSALAIPQPSPVVEVVKILASPSGVAIVFLFTAMLAILIGGGLGESTSVQDIPHPLRQHHAAPLSSAAPEQLAPLTDEDRAALKVRVLQELNGLLGDVVD